MTNIKRWLPHLTLTVVFVAGVAGLSPTQTAGLAELSWLVMPSDIEGVEIYRRPMEIPAQFVVGGYAGCGAIVIWTRWRTALPQTPSPPSGAPHDRD